MTIFFNFTSKIFKQWIIYLGFIPALYDLLNAYLHYDYKFPDFVLIGFPIIIFLYAIYQVYRDEYLKRIDLEKKLEGPTNYQIKAVLYPVDFKKDELIKQLESIRLDVEKKLSSMPSYLKVDNVEKYSQISSIISASVGLHTKTATTYNNELSSYKHELERIISNSEKYKEKIVARIDELSDIFYFIDFSIENTGITSDSEIQVDINCLNKNIVFNEVEITRHGMDIYKLIPSIPKAPEKPEVQNLNQMMGINERAFDFNTPHFDIPNPNAFRKWIEITNSNCSVTIKNLHVGDNVSLFKKKLILQKNDHDIVFEATIKSKASTRVLKPKIIIEISNTPKTLFNFEEKL